jgi:hypothetical protein
MVFDSRFIVSANLRRRRSNIAWALKVLPFEDDDEVQRLPWSSRIVSTQPQKAKNCYDDYNCAYDPNDPVH